MIIFGPNSISHPDGPGAAQSGQLRPSGNWGHMKVRRSTLHMHVGCTPAGGNERFYELLTGAMRYFFTSGG